MRIAHILPALTKGGGERVAVDLANHGADAGHQVVVVVGFPVDPELLQTRLRSGIGIRHVTPGRISKIAFYLRTIAWTVRNRRWLLEQDVVHCHLTFGALVGTLVWYLRRLYRRERPAIVETYHAVGMPIPRVHRWLHSQLAQRRDALAMMTVDDQWRRMVGRGDRPIFRVIPNGIAPPPRHAWDASRVAEARRAMGIPPSADLVVGTVGRMSPERRPWVYLPILRAIADATAGERQVHFLLAGDGPELERIRRMSEEFGLGTRVHLPGLVLNPQDAIRCMDLYLTLNVGSVTGMAALEAALSEVPVVAVQLLEGYRASEEDWIWSSTDVDAVASRAVELLEEPTKRRDLAQRQAAYAREHHTLEAMGRAYDSLYDAAGARVVSARRPVLTTAGGDS